MTYTLTAILFELLPGIAGIVVFSIFLKIIIGSMRDLTKI